MFKNIGGKIMTLAEVVCIIQMIASIVVGVLMVVYSFTLRPSVRMPWCIGGGCVAIFGCFFAWIGAFILYGFGRLVQNSDVCRRCLVQMTSYDDYLDEEIDEEEDSEQ